MLVVVGGGKGGNIKLAPQALFLYNYEFNSFPQKCDLALPLIVCHISTHSHW